MAELELHNASQRNGDRRVRCSSTTLALSHNDDGKIKRPALGDLCWSEVVVDDITCLYVSIILSYYVYITRYSMNVQLKLPPPMKHAETGEHVEKIQATAMLVCYA